ncbi:hypothetical protein SELMODRAFT_442638 [Selaginella moellendorffii]|uniref:Caprin-1 dimerization domain-containing protein n=1 Tax=Selaginella moellendorffii TaxID=88036 RepID=D8RV01_SELML|nr:uncharacterized protein LOC9638208 isoform X1 [Selaginella moellendorffii]EFJ23873.1 hypothetical protein SELMODRAFT_442638 [Selaginella moellendorffii]|eukprot:XP_002975088.1 uncharacterized protein LOC9638208 isoform X1 [Selaginella moellendorffii]
MAALDVSGVEDSSCGKDGPVLTMMNKRLRALKKKYNRIVQLEEAKEKGKAINKEQEDVLKSKVQVLTLMEEYDRLRQPLLVAVREEIAEKEKEWIAAKEEQVSGVASSENLEEARTESEEASNENLENAGSGEADNVGGGGGDPAFAAAATATPAAATEENEKIEVPVDSGSVAVDEHLMLELIQLLYFALLFDVQSQGEAHSFMRTVKYHERVSCLSYDLVTDDSTSHLTDADLDALAAFGSLMTSRPPNTTLSHRDALQACIAHARHWLLNSDAIIDANILNVTYTELRDRLNRILATEYFTMTPELQTVTSEIAVGQFGPELGVPQEHYVNGDAPTENVSDSSGANSEAFQLDVNPIKSLPHEEAQPAEDQRQPDETTPRQHQPQQGFQQKFRGNRGGGGGNVGGGGGANYPRGRGRGGGRGYRGGGNYAPANGNRGGGNAGNGGGQYYDQSGYYQRNSYYGSGGNRRGRGYYSNSSSSNNNNAPNHANGPSPAVAS